MSRIGKDFRTVAKRATQYPSIVVDTHGGRASVRLSGNGAVIHNLSVIGGNVAIGEAVYVDYTTPEPTVVAVSKSWATEEDLHRILARYKVPLPEDPITEFDKVMMFCYRDPTFYRTFPADRNGISAALSYAYVTDEDEFGEYQGFGHWAMRIPPLEYVPINWGSDINFWRPIHLFSEGQIGARFHGYISMEGGGTTVENIHFYWDAEETKGQYPTYNLFLTIWGNDDKDYIMNEGNLTITSGSAFDVTLTRCKFDSFGYDFHTGGSPDPGKYNYEYEQYTNIDLYPPDGSNDVTLLFEDCDFYAMQTSAPWNSGTCLEEAWLAGSGVGRVNVVYKNCRTHEDMPKPFLVNVSTTGEPNIKTIKTVNSQWPGVPDRLAPDRLYDGAQWLLDTELDLSPINHIHSSGSSGGYDEDAFHVDKAGEY